LNFETAEWTCIKFVLFLSATEGSGSHVILVPPVQYVSEPVPEAYKMYYFSKSRVWSISLTPRQRHSARIRYVAGDHQNVSKHGEAQQNISTLDSNDSTIMRTLRPYSSWTTRA
jgi:hypothetical protein